MTVEKIGKRVVTPRQTSTATLVIPGLAAALALAVYLATMNRTYGFIDKGELAAVATTLGIAHPTGYPTLTLLGYLVTRISPLRPVLSLNILAAALTAAGVGLMALVFGHLLRLADSGSFEFAHAETRKELRKTRRHRKPAKLAELAQVSTKPLSTVDQALIAAAAALSAGLTTTWWGQATGFEVYALHAFLLHLVTLFFLRYLERRDVADQVWSGHAFAFVLGLSFTNHMSTIMLAPAFLFLYFRRWKWSRESLRGIVRLIPAFVLGLLPYAYLPIRAAMAPRLNWGDPSTWDSFWAHVGGQQFHFAMFYAPRVFGQQTSYFFNTLVTDTAYVGLIVALVGAIYLARRSVTLAIWTGLLFVTCVVVSGLYDINDIGNYHLAAVFSVGIAVTFGLAVLRKWLGAKGAVAVGFGLVSLSGVLHFREMDESHNYLVEDLTTNVLGPLPEQAVVFTNDWDYWTSGSLYAQDVEGFRRDVVVLDPESLRTEWYLDHLERDQPDLMAPVEGEVTAFRAQVRAFERAKGRFAPSEADAYYNALYSMINALIERNAAVRPFFVTEYVDRRIGLGWQRIPERLAYRLARGESYKPQELPRYAFRAWKNRVDPYALKICERYTMSLLARARYEEAHGHAEKARECGVYALSFDPEFPPDTVPDLPLHIDDQVREVIRNYQQLRERAAATTAR